MPRCAGIKRDGGKCSVTVDPPAKWCWWHDPNNAAQRKAAAARGGRRAGKGRPLQEIQDLRKRLSDLSDQVLNGLVDRADAAVAGQLLNYAIRAISVEMTVREQTELEARMVEIEERLEQRNSVWHG